MCPTHPTGRHIVPTYLLEPTRGGGATVHATFIRTGRVLILADIVVELVIIYLLHQGRTPIRPRPSHQLLGLRLFNTDPRNLNPMAPIATTTTVGNTSDFKGYEY